jgi:hypothetical protein
MRRQGIYQEWAVRAAQDAKIYDAYREQASYSDVPSQEPAELAAEHAAATGVHVIGDAKVWAADAGFDGDWGLREALVRSAITRDVKERIARKLEAILHSVTSKS